MEPLTGRSPRDQNRVPAVFGVSSADGVTTEPLEVNPSTGRLLVDATIGAITGTLDVNVKQVNGTTASTGNGTTDAGTQRVTISSDSTGQVKLATGANVIGSISNTAFTANVGTTNGLALDATLTGGTQQSKLTDGTNLANILKSDGSAAGQNSLMIGGAYQSQSFSVTSVTTSTAYDVGGYASVSVQINTQYTGSTPTIAFQCSNDNSTWFSCVLKTALTFNAPATSTTTTGLFKGQLSGRYFRLNFTGAYSSGTAAGVIVFSTLPATYDDIGVSQAGTWTVGSSTATGSAVPANAFYLGVNDFSSSNLVGVRGMANATNSIGIGILASGLMAQFDDVSPTAITENSFGNMRMSTNRNLYSTIRDAAGNERGANVTASNALVVDNSAVSPSLAPAATALNTYSVHLTTNTTTTPTAATAYISSISISSEVAGTTSTVTVQDKQGTPLKLVNGFSTTTLTTTPTVVNFQTPVKMVSGIDIVTAGAVAATIDIWVNYYQ